MTKTRLNLILVLGLASLALMLAGCSFSLAEDITPPPNYTPPASQETSVVTQTTSASYPVVPPNPANGASIYAEKCSPCHGETGQGDGSRASSLPNPPAAIGSAELARQSSPAAWFNTVTNGNLERFMPPFSGSLSDGQRWDVIAYVYTLSAPPASVALGGELYDQNCASCHGTTGKGDGPDASTRITDFTDQAAAAQRSGDQIYQAITDGVSPAMPDYKDKFSDDQRRAMADYIRFLSYAPSARAAYPGAATPLAAASTPASVSSTNTLSSTIASTQNLTTTQPTTATLGTISGKVINGSGGALPAELQIALHGFDNMSLVLTGTVTIKASGVYSFTNVSMPAGRNFMVSTTYNGASYSSSLATVDPGTTKVNLDIDVYDTITDASSLTVDRMHVFFDFSKPGVVQVIELYLITNPTNKTIVPAKTGEALLTFKLPAGASNLQFQDGSLGGRYLQTPDGFGDTSSIIPGSGQHQVLFGFDLPYTNKLDLVQPVSLPVGAVIVLLPQDGVTIKSSALTDAGTRDVQGTAYHMYNGNKIDAGGSLSLSLSGSPTSGAASTSAASSRNNLIIGLAAFGMVLVLVGLLLYRRSQQKAALETTSLDYESSQPKDEESLIDAIIALDDLYKDGKLPEAAYQQRRAELKAQLKEHLGSG